MSKPEAKGAPAKVVFNLSNPWEMVLKVASEEVAAFRAAMADYRGTARELESIVAIDPQADARDAIRSATTAEEIMSATTDFLVAGRNHPKSEAVFRVNQLKRLGQQNVFALVNPVLAKGRRLCSEVRGLIAARELELFTAFGVKAGKTDLLHHVDAFEKQIGNIERQIQIFSHHLCPPNIPACLAVLDVPQPVQQPLEGKFDPRAEAIKKRLALDMREQDAQLQNHERTLAKIANPNAFRRGFRRRVEAAATPAGDSEEMVTEIAAVSQPFRA